LGSSFGAQLMKDEVVAEYVKKGDRRMVLAGGA
jgi:hypothetical protein